MDEARRDICWYCGGPLIWQNDYDLEDIEDEPGIYTELTCSKCGAFVTYTVRDGMDDE